jgi:hypothetical protein
MAVPRSVPLWRFGLLLLLLPSFFCGTSCEALVYEKYTKLCKNAPTITRKHEKTLQWLLRNVGEGALVLPTSPQHEAACWTIRENKFSPQRFVMATLYFATKGVNWDINTDWVTRKHECKWYGVKCNMFQTIVGLDLGFIKVDGLIPREIGLLPQLRELDLHGNDLQGVIPYKLMAGCTKMEYLRIQMNNIFGSLHKEIVNMVNLKELHLFGNYLGGTIPKELSQLKKLGTCIDPHETQTSMKEIKGASVQNTLAL